MNRYIQYLTENKTLLFVILCSLFINTFKLSAQEFGNAYYASAIHSMSTSFSNFFFLSFDSVGFISIDKAPLSFWLDTGITMLFGFNTWALFLPHAIAGTVLSVIMFLFTRTYFSERAAFIASLTLTISPVIVAVSRTNGPDGYLLISLLLSLWFCIHFFKTQREVFLLLSAGMIGIGFHTKMLQAYLILPSLITAILVFSSESVSSKLKRLGMFLLVVVITSFLWITIVDLTPKTMRPYVGSSQSNSAWELALGYNGIQRLTGINVTNKFPNFDVLRLFTGELGIQTAGLLLPMMMVAGYVLFDFLNKRFLYRFFLKIQYSAVVVASVFLLTTTFFFSTAAFYHPYYLSILLIPLSFLLGVFVSVTLKHISLQRGFLFVSISALIIQILLIFQTNVNFWTVYVLVTCGYWAVGMGLTSKQNLSHSLIIAYLGILIMPTIWSWQTTFYMDTSSPIIKGGPPIVRNLKTVAEEVFGTHTDVQIGVDDKQIWRRPIDPTELDMLKRSYKGETYFVGVIAQHHATSFILDHNIGNILTMGGFSGKDNPITLQQIKSLVEEGQIRFFLLVDPANDEILAASGRNISNQIPQIDGFSAINQNYKLRHNYGYSAGEEVEKIIRWIKLSCELEDGIYDCIW